MRNEAPVTTQVISLWCHEGNHDKLYRMEMQEFKGKFDVFCMYGRRGGRLTMHVWAEGVDLNRAKQVFSSKIAEKFRKGYKEINEDVVEVGKMHPTMR